MEVIEQETYDEILSSLEDKPLSDSDHREQLAVLARYAWEGKGNHWDLTQHQVKGQSEKYIEMYYKRYEASLSSNTCSDIVNTFLQLSCRALSDFLPFDEGKLLKELNDKFSVRRELEMAADQLKLKYREYMAITSSALITAKNINFDQAVVEEPDTFMWKQTEWPTE